MLFVLFAVAFGSNLVNPTAKQIAAYKVNETINIDGILNENIWKNQPFSGFMQEDPNQGQPVSEKTSVWVAYDENALYIAARLYDKSPDSINVSLGRRDNSYSTDEFDVYLDSYNDNRNGFIFCVTAGGTQHDGTITNDNPGWLNYTWDAVWDAKTHVDSQGWSVEMRIPFSQIRFDPKQLVWGINFERDIVRRNERSLVTIMERNKNGFVSKFPDLIGIENVKPKTRLEVLPYFNTRAEYINRPNDPFYNGSRYFPGVGADVKYGLGTNLTLDAAINPDFGQVEVDPAVVNLTDAETFFDEKRPFFTEGATIFQFGRGGGSSFWNFGWNDPTIFYSRRIGRAPQGKISGDFADIPIGTKILGAGKISGRILNDWKFGTIHAVTEREFATVETNGVNNDIQVEPLTYYGVLRAQKDFNNGDQGIGLLATYSKRLFNDENLDKQLSKNAMVVGADGWSFLDESRSYVFTGAGAISYINGTKEMMTALQRNSIHYFQRPDAKNLKVDLNRTSMTGYYLRTTLQKLSGPMDVNAAFGIINPNFEINDMGYQTRSDLINYHLYWGYKWLNPTQYYRRTYFGVCWSQNHDFEGNSLNKYIWAKYNYMFTNYLETEAVFIKYFEAYSNRLTRGGPIAKMPASNSIELYINTDERRNIVANFSCGIDKGEFADNYFVQLFFQLKPVPIFNLSIGPEFRRDINSIQYLTAKNDLDAVATFGKRYIFGKIDQKTLSANIRLNWIMSPKLSLQFYLQPLIASGDYSDYKELKKAKTDDYLIYGTEGSTITKITDDGQEYYKINPMGNSSQNSFIIPNYNFNYKSLRGNAVLRWEYMPGSTIFFVWTQSREDYEADGRFELSKSLNRLVESHPENIFMVKVNYWLNM